MCDVDLSVYQGNMDQERLKKQKELAAATALYQQLQQQQLFQLINRWVCVSFCSVTEYASCI